MQAAVLRPICSLRPPAVSFVPYRLLVVTASVVGEVGSMSTSSTGDWLLSTLVSLPTLVFGSLVGVTSFAILVWRWRALSAVYRIVLAVACVVATALVLGLIGLALAFGSQTPPPAPPRLN